MEKIDVCMTATIRPSIINRTLSSFTEKMINDKSRYRLILNIDPIGENVKRKNIYKNAKKYFDEIILNCPDEPGFTKAVQWCWHQTSSKYIFHLEDDWNLIIPININYMIDILEKNADLVSLRLNKENTRINKSNIKYARKNGFVYHDKISLNPTLFKGDFLRNVSKLMDLNKNPEKQLRINNTTKIGIYLKDFTHGIYTKESINKVVLDIGRQWMDSSSYTKKTGFLNWEKIN